MLPQRNIYTHDDCTVTPGNSGVTIEMQRTRRDASASLEYIPYTAIRGVQYYVPHERCGRVYLTLRIAGTGGVAQRYAMACREGEGRAIYDAICAKI
jgi:hypothetical protein